MKHLALEVKLFVLTLGLCRRSIAAPREEEWSVVALCVSLLALVPTLIIS